MDEWRRSRPPGRHNRDEQFEDYRQRTLAGLERVGRAASALYRATVDLVDRVVRSVDEWSERMSQVILRTTGIDRDRLSVNYVLSRSPSGIQSAVATVDRWLAMAGRRFTQTFAFLPGDLEWRRAATGMALLLVIVTFANFFAPPEAKPIPGGRRLLLVGYFENGWSASLPDSFPTFQRHFELVDMVIPFWHSIHPSGEIEDRGVRREVIDFAHAHDIAVIPLFNNAKVGNSAGFLVSAAAREEAIREILELVETNGYDGVHIDFELLPPEWREEFTSFIAELRVTLGMGRHLSVAVFPKVEVDPEIHGLYDYAALSGLTDFIVLMGYDRHWATAPAGPISPHDWIEDNLRLALNEEGVPADRLVLAVGGYGYDWPNGGGPGNRASVIAARFAPDLARRRGATLAWDNTSNNPFFSYWVGGTRHDVWYQDHRVMEMRIEQARKYRLRGLALWRIGYETDATWTVLDRAIGPR